MNITPIPIHPWPAPQEHLDIVRQAYESLGVQFSVQPVPASPGEPGRVLGLGAFAPFVCDLAYVPDPTDLAQVTNRLRWLLLAPRGDNGGFMVADYMRALLGPETREVTDER